MTSVQDAPIGDITSDKYPTRRMDAIIRDHKGNIIYQMLDVVVPAHWRDSDITQVVQKYLHPKDERNILKMINRVTSTIAQQGLKLGYFDSAEEARAYQNDLFDIVYYQKASWNSPVWFNVGIVDSPQVWACLILKVEDSMHGEHGIMQWWQNEIECFLGGSGVGANISAIRGDGEPLSGGKGTASGPLSFMRVADGGAGGIKSGGRTRRAAKMVIMNVDHPDIVEYIEAKARAEDISQALLNAGFDIGMNGKDSPAIPYQNANNSVRVTDDFMNAVLNDGEWQTKGVTTGKITKYRAKDIWDRISRAAWRCADPGLQFDTTINEWHTTPSLGRINSSNPCSEYMHLDDSVCNLASLNILAFFSNPYLFDVTEFMRVARLMFISQDILVSISSYPKESVRHNAIHLRQLGLGYTNIGGSLLYNAYSYDSNEGRDFVAGITYLLQGTAARTSAEMARKLGPYTYWDDNRDANMRVLDMHRKRPLDFKLDNSKFNYLWEKAELVWDDAHTMSYIHGQRNAQLSVIAPTGTISFLMGAVTTGIEPVYAYNVDKTLVGGGITPVGISINDRTIVTALKLLSGTPLDVDLEPERVQELWDQYSNNHVFKAANEKSIGGGVLTPEAHLRMMAVAQPSVSGAISKTVNMPEETTVEEVSELYMLAWRLGLKAVAIYRDNCKTFQPLNVAKDDAVKDDIAEKLEKAVAQVQQRVKMPGTRQAVVHKFNIGGQDFYLTAGFYPDGRLGEIFLKAASEGSFSSGMCDAFATMVSIALQYGVPLEVMTEKFIHRNFEPNGVVISDSSIKMTRSLVEYIFLWLNLDEVTDVVRPITFEDAQVRQDTSVLLGEVEALVVTPRGSSILGECPDCHSYSLQRTGSCNHCNNCGYDEGCG